MTSECCEQKDAVFGRQVTVVDTLSLFDTSLPESTVKREISNVSTCRPQGPTNAWKNTIILFTYGDKVKSDIERQLKEAGPELQEIMRKAGNRYHVLNNLKINDQGQVLELLEKVEEMVADNGG